MPAAVLDLQGMARCKAAERGFVWAQNDLGMMYDKGEVVPEAQWNRSDSTEVIHNLPRFWSALSVLLHQALR